MRTRSHDGYDLIEKVALAFGAVFLFTAFLIIACLLGAIFGAFAGWVVSWVFPEAIIRTLGRFGVNTAGLQMWELGAMFGFIGGFLRTSVSSSKSD